MNILPVPYIPPKMVVIGRLIQRYHQTGTVNDRPRSGRPRLTFPREDRLLTRRTKQNPFTSHLLAVKGIDSHLTNEYFASSVYSTEDGRLPTEVVLDGGVVTNKDV
jgi:hypothetical protein